MYHTPKHKLKIINSPGFRRALAVLSEQFHGGGSGGQVLQGVGSGLGNAEENDQGPAGPVGLRGEE